MIELVFTITQGRTGSKSLSELFKRRDPEAVAFHEHVSTNSHGVLTPDVGQMRRFNDVGMTQEITNFWKRKLALVSKLARTRGRKRYVETAHMNAKAGLIEHVLATANEGDTRFRFIILNRAPEKIARSMYEHGDMVHVESMWLWYLHPTYSRNLVDPRPYLLHGHLGKLAWYVREMEARKSFYRALLDGRFDVLAVDIDRPDWSEAVARSYGLDLADGDHAIVANEGASRDDRSKVEHELREIFAAVPPSARADKLADGVRHAALGRRVEDANGESAIA